MSQVNVEYVLKHNSEIKPEHMEVCLSSIEVTDKSVDAETRKAICAKCGIPLEKMCSFMGAAWENRRAYGFSLNI